LSDLILEKPLFLLAQATAKSGCRSRSHGLTSLTITLRMLLGIAWMFDGIPEDIAPGLQRYPAI
jgi:hypothetical protein